MEIERVRALRGPNLWTRRTAIEALVRCTPIELEVDRIAGFEARLRERFPQMDEWHMAGSVEPVPLARVLELATLGLQTCAGCRVTFSHTVATVDDGVYQVVVEYSEEAVGRKALEAARQLCEAAMRDRPFDVGAQIGALHELDEDIRLGPSTGSIVDAAVARGIPYRRLTDGSLVQFGWGSRARRIQAAEIDATSAIAESIAQDKDLTKALLEAAGVPVPEGRPVRTLDEAWEAMEALGGRVVVKPQDGNQGKGVTVNIATREQLEHAYAAARDHSRHVLVERFIAGHDFRLLVVGDRLVAAARRDPPFVIGDGVHTVTQLVAEVNRDPRRGDGHATSLTRIRLDDIAKARLTLQGMAVDSVPPHGQRVVLRNNANLSTGGTATDVTDEVHPEVAARAVDAARAVGLDICGVDIVCRTVFAPLEQQGGGIVEVNAAPGLRMHLSPSFGKGRAVGAAVIATLFGSDDDGRIPIVAVTGTNGKTTTAKLIARILETSGLRVGTTGTDGIRVGNSLLDTGDCSGPKSARNVLLHPDVDAAVFETARGGILREGLGFDRCSVAVVTNIGHGDHLGLNYIHTAEDLAVLKRVIVQNVAPRGTAVLNAEDPLVVPMAEVCPGDVIWFGPGAEGSATDGGSLIAYERARGRRVVFRRGNRIIAARGETEVTFDLESTPLTLSGAVGFQVENVMAAVAAAWALAVDWAAIHKALADFVSDSRTAPGRFNLMDYRGAKVIADYGHNPDAMLALVSAVGALPARRRSVVISGAGDRRDEDLIRQTEILGSAFDDVILYQDAAQRGRADGEVLALLRKGLEGARRADYVAEIRGEFVAIDHALSRLEAGDLCLVLVDQVDEALAHLATRVDEASCTT
ncbi:MAG: cyanophycin synthetase [Burkholderiaceae bacterium]